MYFDNISLVTVPGIEATFEGLAINPEFKGLVVHPSGTPAPARLRMFRRSSGMASMSPVGLDEQGRRRHDGNLFAGDAAAFGGRTRSAVTFKTALNQTLTGIGNAATPDYTVLPMASASLSRVSGQPGGIAIGQHFQTAAGNPNGQGEIPLNWTEEQLLGLRGPNLITGTWPPAPISLTTRMATPNPCADGNFRVGGSHSLAFMGWRGLRRQPLGFGSNPRTQRYRQQHHRVVHLRELPAPASITTVNSDDGFRLTTARNAKDRLGDVISLFEVAAAMARSWCRAPRRTAVEQPGVYPIRGFIENGGGGFNIKWYTLVGANSTW